MCGASQARRRFFPAANRRNGAGTAFPKIRGKSPVLWHGIRILLYRPVFGHERSPVKGWVPDYPGSLLRVGIGRTD